MDGPELTWGRDMPGDLTDKWPKTDAGDLVAPALLMSCGQADMSDTITIGMLESFGIPCFRRFPHYGGFGNLMLGMSAEGVDLFVPETMLDDARALLEGGQEDE